MSKTVLLSTLDERCPDLQLADGRTVPIREIDGIGMQLLQSMSDPETGTRVTYWDVAVRILPDLPEAEVRAMTLSQVAHLVSIACGSALKVLDALGESPAPATAGTPVPPPEIPSAT